MAAELPPNNRILIVDDNPAIHEDFRKIFEHRSSRSLELDSLEATLRDEQPIAVVQVQTVFELDSAFQGQEGLEKAVLARKEERPYAMAFIDVRMPPGWDGIETVERLWEVCPDIQVVLCTAYSDYSWKDITLKLRQPESFVILKKPFESIEVLQMAHALTRKWLVTQQANLTCEHLEFMVRARTRAYEFAHDKLAQEITERTQAQADLRTSDERFEKAFRANPLAVAIWRESDECHVDINEAFLKLTGLTYSQAHLKTADDLGIYADPVQVADLRQKMSGHQPINDFACPILGKLGIRQTRIAAERFTYEEGPHWLLLVEDRTDKQNLEDSLRQAQKMEAVGQLAAGVAHDFNNLLTVILSHADRQLIDKCGNDSVLESFREIAAAAERAANLTRQLLAFSRKQVLHYEALDLRSSISSVSKLLLRLIGADIQMKIECDPDLPPIQADACSLEQILLNLVLNARDAMPNGGSIIVRAGQATISEADQDGTWETAPGNYARLSVSDTGIGMDKVLIARIFEPFFTTKSAGKGTGMGLATVHGIVKQHSGWLRVKSEVGRGSTFEVYFPYAARPILPSNADHHLRATGRIIGTVLLVEDEFHVRKVVSTLLEAAGCDVLQASSGPEALSVWHQNRQRIGLLFTDMVMPGGILGGQLAAQLQREQPNLKVIYTSGYSAEVISLRAEIDEGEALDLEEGRNYLAKPLRQENVLAAVGQALAISEPPASEARKAEPAVQP